MTPVEMLTTSNDLHSQPPWFQYISHYHLEKVFDYHWVISFVCFWYPTYHCLCFMDFYLLLQGRSSIEINVKIVGILDLFHSTSRLFLDLSPDLLASYRTNSYLIVYTESSMRWSAPIDKSKCTTSASPLYELIINAVQPLYFFWLVSFTLS